MELTTWSNLSTEPTMLFMMSKIQNLNGTHNVSIVLVSVYMLFMMSKIQNLNGTHNIARFSCCKRNVVYDVKDTKFEWNSQRDSGIAHNTRSCL